MKGLYNLCLALSLLQGRYIRPCILRQTLASYFEIGLFLHIFKGIQYNILIDALEINSRARVAKINCVQRLISVTIFQIDPWEYYLFVNRSDT